MLGNAASYLIQTVFEFFAGVLLLRFWLQLARLSGRNALSTFVQALTNFIVVPARRVIPGLWGFDLSTLVLAWLTLAIAAAVQVLLRGMAPDAWVLLAAIVMLLRLAVYLAIGAIFLMVIISWVNPSSPMHGLANGLTRPMLRPIQRVVPTIGMVDLSPLIALVVLQLILIVPIAWAEQAIIALR